jgi:hypothetical protein
LLRHIKLNDYIQVQNFGGVTELNDFLAALAKMSAFDTVDTLGIVRDAEKSAGRALQSVCSSLKRRGLPFPKAPGLFEGSEPKVGVFILPDGKSPGMLEDLCLRSVGDDPAMPCLDRYFGCLETADSLPKNLSKGRVQAFLASRAQPGLLLGEAAGRKYWPWDHTAFNHVKRFLHAM